MHKQSFVMSALCALVMATSALAQTGVPSADRIIRFNGSVSGASAGAQTLRFAVYDEETGGNLLWEEVQTAAVDAAGNYSVFLGGTSADGLPVALFANGAPRWLSVERAGTAVGPRALLAAVPYAVSAANATSLGGRPAADYLLTPRARAAAAASTDGAATADRDPQLLVNNGTANFIGKFFNNVDLINSQLFDNGTNVGVGTTNPLDKFHVQFTNTGGSLTGYAVQNLGSTATSFSGMLFYDHTNALRQFQGYSNGTGEYRINNISPTGSINFLIGSSSQFRITTSGDIGLGAGTNTPDVKLHMFSSGIDGVTVRGSRLRGTITAPTAVFSGDSLARFEGSGYTGAAFAQEKAMLRMSATENWTATANGTQMEFYTTATGGTALAERMRITNNGDVGIGNNAPSYKLDVSYVGGSSGIRLASTAGFAAVDVFGSTGTSGIRFGDASSLLWYALADSSEWRVGEFGSGDRMNVDTLGNVTIGTGTTGCLRDRNATVIAGTCSSDLRFKKDVTPFAPMLDKLSRLQPVSYFWRASDYADRRFGTEQSWGLIAQDVEQVMPELVVTDEQGYRAVNYSRLPLVTIQAVKELNAVVELKDAEIKSLTERIVALEAAIKSMTTAIQQQR